MPSDSSGVYSLPAGYLATTGATATAAQHNTPLEDIEDALTDRVMTTGVSTMTGPLKAADGSAGAPSIAFANSLTTGFFRKAANVIGLAIAGVEVTEIKGPIWSTGDVKLTLKTTADAGWVMMNDGTIGSAASLATTRANADTADLYALLWNNVSDTYAPVSGGRGANAAADFAANKPIALTKVLGRALGISGAGSGLTSRALGLTVGTETHQLSEAEMPVHTHTFTGSALPTHKHSVNLGNTDAANGIARGAVTATGAVDTDSVSAGTPSGTNSNTGSGTAHNNMQPTSFLNAMIKL